MLSGKPRAITSVTSSKRYCVQAKTPPKNTQSCSSTRFYVACNRALVLTNRASLLSGHRSMTGLLAQTLPKIQISSILATHIVGNLQLVRMVTLPACCTKTSTVMILLANAEIHFVFLSCHELVLNQAHVMPACTDAQRWCGADGIEDGRAVELFKSGSFPLLSLPAVVPRLADPFSPAVRAATLKVTACLLFLNHCTEP